MRYIRLTEVEKQVVVDLQKMSANSVVRERCLWLLLSDRGNSMSEVARVTQTNWLRIVRLFNAWDKAIGEDKFSVLSIAAGRGAKVKLQPYIQELKVLVEEHNRNVKPILKILEKEHSIKVSKLTLLNFLKGTGL